MLVPKTMRHIALTLFLLASSSWAGPVEARKSTPHQVRLRIEGALGTIFEGIVFHPGPCNATVSSDPQPHSCNGTNAGANPFPGATPTCAAIQAGKHTHVRPFAGPFAPFDLDGEWYPNSYDFFIERIGNTSQTATQFWGILVDYQFTPTGGCQFEVQRNQEILWAFDAFNANKFLKLTGPTAPVKVGKPFTVNVIDGSTGNPVQGASVGGQTTDAAGNAQLVQSTRGRALYKAFAPSAIRSNFIAVRAH